eukprot:12895797-Prorocentrum_lima.AAC.1
MDGGVVSIVVGSLDGLPLVSSGLLCTPMFSFAGISSNGGMSSSESSSWMFPFPSTVVFNCAAGLAMWS